MPICLKLLSRYAKEHWRQRFPGGMLLKRAKERWYDRITVCDQDVLD